MKKFIALISAAVLCFTSGCANKTANEETIDEAAKLVGEKWESVYEASPFEIGKDKHLEVKNTRIVRIKDTGLEELENVDYVIDFLLLTNYSGTAPYYTVADYYNSVAVYKDGSMDCDLDVFAVFTGTYGNDFDKLIASVEDYGSDYNREIKVK